MKLIQRGSVKIKQSPSSNSSKTLSQVFSHIVELTEEEQTCRYEVDNIQKKNIIIKKAMATESYKEEQTEVNESKCVNIFGCLRFIKMFCSEFGGEMPAGNEMNVNKSDFAELVEKIRNEKTRQQTVLPPQVEKKKSLVLDLDDTLVHTTFAKPEKYDFQLQITLNKKPTKIYSIKRFGLDAFLFEMSELFEIIIFTASQKHYADKVIAQIDPKRRISNVLYRDHCLIVNKTFFLKNLKILGRQLKNTIIVDDNKIAGTLQPDNFYKIDQYRGGFKDRKLLRLSSFLKHIHKQKNFLPIHQSRKKYEEIEIKIKEENELRSISQRKKQYSHKKTTSEVQSLAETITPENIQNGSENEGNRNISNQEPILSGEISLDQDPIEGSQADKSFKCSQQIESKIQDDVQKNNDYQLDYKATTGTNFFMKDDDLELGE